MLRLKIAIIMLCLTMQMQAAMYIGANGAIIGFEEDNTTAIGIGGSTGWSTKKQSFKVDKYNEINYSLAGLLGYKMSLINLELEAGLKFMKYSANNPNISEFLLYQLSSIYGITNAIVHLSNPTPFSPYLGAGIGFAKVYYDDSKSDIPAAQHTTELVRGVSGSKVSQFLGIYDDKISKNHPLIQLIYGVSVAVTRSVSLSCDWKVVTSFYNLKFSHNKNNTIYISSPYNHKSLTASLKVNI